MYRAAPEVREIDKQLRLTSAKIAGAIALGKGQIQARMAQIQSENETLQRRRAETLIKSGYPADYTEPRYSCPECGDTGFVGNRECICRKRELVRVSCANSGIGENIRTQTFDSFSPSANPSETISAALRKMRDYAENFTGEGDENLLLVGGAGRGKTHLSSAVAGVLIERGFDVKYASALDLVTDFERWQFYRRDGDDDPTESYLSCDLLILDDLGTEMTNNFVLTSLYSVLDKRINARRAMIISTNLTSKAIREKYDARISSRLFGNFTFLVFEGRDVRMRHLMQ